MKRAAPIHCYVYYRIAAEHAAAARAAVEGALRAVEARIGIVGRLLEGADDPMLWMEVYENVPDVERLEALLDTELGLRRFAACLAPGSKRATERFVAHP